VGAAVTAPVGSWLDGAGPTRYGRRGQGPQTHSAAGRSIDEEEIASRGSRCVNEDVTRQIRCFA